MSRTTAVRGVLGALGAATALTAAAFAAVAPSSGAGAADRCVAWGTLPARVTLGPHGATIRTALHGTAACAGRTADNGATALLRGPGRNNDVPMRWTRFGATDEATYYPSLNRPGTYRIVDGATQTYDENYERIPASWHVTATAVKYKGRFAHVSRGSAGVAAALEFYGRDGWHRHGDVAVSLQRRTSGGGWRTVARTHSGAAGRVHFAAHAGGADYRLVSAASKYVWGAIRVLASARA